jgi:hypothetical protein
MELELSGIERAVLTLAHAKSEMWQDMSEHYWLARLTEEVGELASSLIDRHEDLPEWELMEIASIALNFLRLRAIRAGQDGVCKQMLKFHGVGEESP